MCCPAAFQCFVANHGHGATSPTRVRATKISLTPYTASAHHSLHSVRAVVQVELHNLFEEQSVEAVWRDIPHTNCSTMLRLRQDI
eukprot:4224054-Amphidinium_carterae.2